MYYYELHCHTSVGSACSRQTPEELIACYAGAGYRGVVLTDHFGRGNTAVPRELPWAEQMQRFFSAADRAKAAARAFGMEVHFAVEFGLPMAKEVLLYGLPRAFFLDNPDLGGLLLPALSERVRRAGGLVFWAHPFRVRDYIPDPSAQLDAALLDGVEAENYCDPDEVNEGAWRFAAAHDLPVSAGSDNHRGLDALQNGLAVPEPLYTADDLKAALRKRDKTLLVRGWERETAERGARA